MEERDVQTMLSPIGSLLLQYLLHALKSLCNVHLWKWAGPTSWVKRYSMYYEIHIAIYAYYMKA